MLGAVFPAAGYLLGSISPGLLLARTRGLDLRSIGSGNVGATNVGRALGRGAYLTVLGLDALKGFAPTLAARMVLGADNPWVAATGVAAVIGHCWPVWHGFEGGKGAATGVGVLSAAVPPAGGAAALTFYALKRITRRASVGSLGGAAAGASATWLLLGASWRSGMAGALLALIVLRHADNIRRLLERREPES